MLKRRISFERRLKRLSRIQPDDTFFGEHLGSQSTAACSDRLENRLNVRNAILLIGLVMAVIGIYTSRAYKLQVTEGAEFTALAIQNIEDSQEIPAERGVITDRHGQLLAWNEETEEGYSERVYASAPALAHIVGYSSQPARDKYGVYYRVNPEGVSGVELSEEARLKGVNGRMIVETKPGGGDIIGQSVAEEPVAGENIELSIDAEASETLYNVIKSFTEKYGYHGGAGVIMDVTNGEVVVSTSYPSFENSVLAKGEDAAAINAILASNDTPTLNRTVSGVYTPGSIVKPFMAIAALEEDIIDPSKQILSTGELRLENPYHPELPSIFKDWKAHGWVDMRHAIALSSNVYFYEIGGGFKDQPGLGISRIEKYAHSFGFGTKTNIDLPGEVSGTVPNPAWKKANFGEEVDWLLGDTYHTVIGQYGWQVTPLQVARAYAALANGGTLFTPTVLRGTETKRVELPFASSSFQIAREGMRLGAREGTAVALNMSDLPLAGKTGTAQTGTHNQFMNSWVVGFFPYDNPRFAFAVMMEQAKSGTLMGGAGVMRQFFDTIGHDYFLNEYE